MFLSIIIPAYNVEPYIGQCLESCLDQDLDEDDYEIIVINDGSIDKTQEIAERYVSLNRNVILITQENKGQGEARNEGLKIAKGDYIWFVDSDDWIEKDCLNKIRSILQKESLEALKINSYLSEDGQLTKCKSILYYDETISGKDFILFSGFIIPVWYTIYRKDFLIQHGLRFTDIYHEDLEFTPRAYYYLKSLRCINCFFYYHRKAPGSIMQTPSVKRSLNLIDASVSLWSFINEIGERRQKRVLCDLISGAGINSALFNTLKLEKDNWTIINNKIESNKKVLFALLKGSKIIYKVEGIILFLLPSYSVQIYRRMAQFFKY